MCQNLLFMKSVLLKAFFSLVVLFALLFMYYQLWFLRQPDRQVPNDPAAIISPANGKVVAVIPWHSDSLRIQKADRHIRVMVSDVAQKGTMISIEMNVTHVHYQRAPLSAQLVDEQYTPGRFRNALIQTNKYGVRSENEHNSLLFETPEGLRYKVVQIAGLLARRIEDYLEPGEQVQKGEVIGLIKLGSQVSLILPDGLDVQARVGDVVTDGETVLARMR